MNFIYLIRIIAIALYLLLSVDNISFSQNRFGVSTGVGFSKDINSVLQTSFKTGFEINGEYKIDIKKSLNLKIICGFKQRGFKNEIYFPSTNTYSYYKANYNLITFGPDLIVPFNKEKNKAYFLIGLKSNYFLSGSYLYSDNICSHFSKLQFESNAGLGWKFKSGIFIESIISGNFINKVNKLKDTHLKSYDLYIGLLVGIAF